MKIEELIARKLWRVRAFDGLPISSAFWNDSLEYQDRHRQLHARALHRPGIVYGLEVVPTPDGKGVRVAPGVGIDPDGNIVVNDSPTTFPITDDGLMYVLMHGEEKADPQTPIQVGGRTEHWRKEDGRHISIYGADHRPRRPYLELARIARKGADRTITEPANELAPGANEVNRLHRQRAFPYCPGYLSVAELTVVPQDRSVLLDTPNRGGLFHLLQEAAIAGYHVHFQEALNLSRETVDSENLPTVLYLSQSAAFLGAREGGQQFTANLQRFLGNGGTLLADAAKGSGEFVNAFTELVKPLAVRLRKVEAGNRLLTARYLFPHAPGGAAGSGELLADPDAGVILFTGDYGGAWQGRAPNREAIRQAVEMGVNILAFAAARKRTVELSRMT